MPLVRTILARVSEKPVVGCRCGFVSPDARGRCSGVRVFTFIVVAFAIAGFLSPDAVRAARLAGEDEPVSTAPAPSRRVVRPAPKPAERREAPGKTSVAQAAVGAVAAPDASVPPEAAAPEDAGTPPPVAQQAGEKPRQSASPAKEPRYVTIDFDNVDIQVFIKFVSELTGRNFLIDEKVRGKVTVVSPKKIPVDEVYKVFESVMEIYGFATVPAGEVIKVVPAMEARAKNMELHVGSAEIAPEDKIVTQILSLQHASPDEMKKVLDPLISKNSIVLAYAPAGMLIITDVLSNIKRLQDIVTTLDVEGVGEVISYIPLQAASASEIVKALTAVFPPLQRPGGATIRVVADDRTRSVILLANENNTANVKKLISLMDKDIPRTVNNLHVYRLQNGNAEDMVKVLMNIPKVPVTTQTTAAGQTTVGRLPVLSRDLNVVADKATNTLIITADRDDYRIVEEVIRKLDAPRPMVYIEALIMEVLVSKSFNIGVEWRGLKDVGSAALSGLGPNATGLGLAGFTGQSIIPQVSSTGAISMPPGFSLGVIGAGIQIGNTLFPNIGAVVQAYRTDSDVSILSTPQLLTLNNEDAEINVGRNVPYITRVDTSAVIPGQTFGQSFEYRDVGIILKMTPNINEEQFIRLKIDQQVTKLADAQTTTTPTTLKRTAKTTVVIKDKETIVIGGLIDDTTSVTTNAVPCAADVPGLGWLFKTMSQSRDRNNLFIFITPHIVRNQAEAAAIYQRKIEDVGIIEEGIIKMNEKKTLQKPQTNRKE